jgi:hypothetical protein
MAGEGENSVSHPSIPLKSPYIDTLTLLLGMPQVTGFRVAKALVQAGRPLR